MYYIRSDKGILIASIVESEASKILLNCDGTWEVKKYKDGTSRRAYVFKQDFDFGSNTVRFFAYTDYYMYKSE